MINILKYYKTYLLSFLFLILLFLLYTGFHKPLYDKVRTLELQNDSLVLISNKIDSIQSQIIRDTVIKTVYKREIIRRVEYINRKDVKLHEVKEAFKRFSL